MSIQGLLSVLSVLAVCAHGSAAGVAVRENGAVLAKLVPPVGPSARVVDDTLNEYLNHCYGWSVPRGAAADQPGLYILAGNERDNAALAELVSAGLRLDLEQQGSDGFRLLTHEAGNRRFIIIAANEPAGLKHGCQELVFFRLHATLRDARLDWPLDVRMKPQFANRAIYMLPCWAAHDSIASWQRVLRFNSELALNRVWFWLNGFPLIPEYGGEYPGTDLADVKKVRGLVDLCRREQMKFLIGGGWFHWHHLKHAGGSPDKPASSFGGLGAEHIRTAGASTQRGVQYYLDMVKLLPRAEGIFLEPPG